ncbi:hypothetical protein EC968_000547 [Mortierella alpina]|nr:hypothetical protein EC968_000547 [Mortierella alpina]
MYQGAKAAMTSISDPGTSLTTATTLEQVDAAIKACTPAIKVLRHFNQDPVLTRLRRTGPVTARSGSGITWRVTSGREQPTTPRRASHPRIYGVVVGGQATTPQPRPWIVADTHGTLTFVDSSSFQVYKYTMASVNIGRLFKEYQITSAATANNCDIKVTLANLPKFLSLNFICDTSTQLPGLPTDAYNQIRERLVWPRATMSDALVCLCAILEEQLSSGGELSVEVETKELRSIQLLCLSDFRTALPLIIRSTRSAFHIIAMNTLKCIKTPAVSAVLAARNLFATRALSSSAIVAQNVREDLKQAANRDSTWSENQIEKKLAFRGPRFENTDIDAQPQPKAAIELIAEEPIRMVEGRRARCDGGGGALGHPAVWINLDRAGAHACGYCGIRFEQKPHHH